MANPFDDDVDISSFYKPQTKPGKPVPQSPSDDLNFYEQQIEQILQNTVDSSSRGVLMLEESEQIGIATAQDLVSQGEKLQKVDRQLDEINATTKYSQRHLNNIKSVFGGIKNYFSKAPPPPLPNKEKERDSKLAGAVSRLEAQAQSDYASLGGAGVAPPAGSSSLGESTRAVLAGTRWEVMNNQVDENLDQMSANLRRLRALGSALGQEVDDQNSVLDSISRKAERADAEVRAQDRQMKRLLAGGSAGKSKSVPTPDAQPPPSLLGRRAK